jgi:penicillin-binding protein 1A
MDSIPSAESMGRIRAHRPLFVAAMIALLLVVWGSVAVGLWFFNDIFRDIPDDAALRRSSTMARATTLFDATDHPTFTIYRERRIEVPLADVSPHVVKAILAVEDQRFYDHGGMDVVRVAGAALRNLRVGRPVEGASTLTQQLARQTFLTREKTLRRKVKEVIVAARLEHEFTKDQILTFYLNKVYFGDGLYGIEAASRGFFGKHAKDLNLSEAALLAGLVKSPSAYAPTVDRTRAIARRDVVLQTMHDAGAIDDVSYARALEDQPQLSDTLRIDESYGQYFKEEVRKQLVRQFGWERVYEGGLKVYTTLDPPIQRAAEAEVARAIADIEQKQARDRGGPAGGHDVPLQGALVALDPRTGEVRALVGGRSFDQSHFNRATQARRQPGSAFKPFVYAAALEQGYTPGTLITGLDAPIYTPEGAWVPEDDHGAASMTMRAALRTSSNRAAVRMLQDVGLSTALRYVERLGVGSVPSVPSLALGSGEVTLLAMTSAYGAFANEGMLMPSTLIRRVESANGDVLYTASQRAQRAVSEATAFIMSAMMADVVSGGTAWQARRVGFMLPAAGKTGTTNDYHDAWFIGYTPRLVSGVWVGYDQPRTIIGHGYASDLAVPLWGRFMRTATIHEAAEWLQPPATVTAVSICRMSGKLATDGCRSAEVFDRDGIVTHQSMVYSEYFVRGTEPEEYCPYHRFTEPPHAVATSGQLPAPPPSPPSATNRAPDATSAPLVPPAVTSPAGLGTTGTPSTTVSTPTREAAPTPPRRGFWSGLFRRGDPAPPSGGTPTPPPQPSPTGN